MHYGSMGDVPTPKQRLPYPYNQDLSDVLSHLNRRTVLGRRGAANDVVTAGYLAAAMRLVGQHVGPADPEDAENLAGDGVDRSVLSFLSQRAVAAELANNPEPFPRMGNVATMRSTWKSQADFIADLISFALWSGYYPESYQETRAAGAERLASDASPALAIEDLAYRVAQALQEMVSFRLQLIAIASAERCEIVQRSLAAKYHRAHESWKQVYAEFLDIRGLRLRPGITLDQITCILTSIVEGSILRAISDPDADVIDHIEHRSLLGTAATVLFNGCVEPIESTDRRSVAEALDDMVQRRPRKGENKAG